MTSTTLSKLADLIEEDSLPQWLREQVQQRSTEIAEVLEAGRLLTLRGPHGQQITISPVDKTKHAAA